MSGNINTTKVEERCQSFIERCFLAHERKNKSPKDETKILSMLEEVVDKLEKGTVDTSKESTEPSLLTLPVSNIEEIEQFLPANTVYDAIPLNKKNLSILCTPVEYSKEWILEDKATNALTMLKKQLEDLKQSLLFVPQATEWFLDEKNSINPTEENTSILPNTNTATIENKKKI